MQWGQRPAYSKEQLQAEYWYHIWNLVSLIVQLRAEESSPGYQNRRDFLNEAEFPL